MTTPKTVSSSMAVDEILSEGPYRQRLDLNGAREVSSLGIFVFDVAMLRTCNGGDLPACVGIGRFEAIWFKRA